MRKDSVACSRAIRCLLWAGLLVIILQAMNDSPVIDAGAPREERDRWLLLIHQVPPKPDYLRVKVRRRLQRLGAVALKNSVYVLPATPGRVEDFQWLAKEIEGDGGEAIVCEASFVTGIVDDELTAQFSRECDRRYAEIADEAALLSGEAGAGTLFRVKRKLADAVRLDFFQAPGRHAAEAALTEAEARVLHGKAAGGDRQTDGTLRGRTWVTRSDVFIDRMASAWLIRRFIDPDARFRFVAGDQHRPASGELRFDTFEGEFTHEGDRCTFEVLLEKMDLRDDPGLVQISEIVHDIDLKDGKFGRPETPGLELLIAGIARSEPDDERRIERGAALFDSLYAAASSPGGAG
ncbi:MAG TPA: chromate resistance protein ChrB domain-containing protein [Longimicrobium sp.]